MPVDAASSTPISVTVTARPPRTPPSRRTKFVMSVAAMPERSSIRPMKMNIGSATSTQLCITSQMRSTVIDAYAQSTPTAMPRSTSATMPMAVNATARPPRTQATG